MFIGKFEDDKNSVIVTEGDVIGFFFFCFIKIFKDWR